MSTRGAVAIRRKGEKDWEGVFNHWDSYPTGLGPVVWAEVLNHGSDVFAKTLLEYDDWDDYMNRSHVCDDEKMTPANSDPLFIEWVYVVDLNKNRLEVWSSRQGQNKAWEHYLVSTFELDGAEPNWKFVEEQG